MDRFKNKNVIIIGAGQTPGSFIGNGRATALKFAEEGANLFITAKHFERAEETAKLITEKFPTIKVLPYELDSTNESLVKKALAFAYKKFGKINVLVNDVGIMNKDDTDLKSMNENVFDLMINTNVKSAIFLYKNIFEYMQNGSSIVQISSIAGICSGTNLYSLTKSSMIDVGQSFAKLYAKNGIRVNTIILGKVKTSMGINFNVEKSGLGVDEVSKLRDESIPLKGGQGTAFDTANAVLFLASDDAKFITGANLPVDGGESIGFLR